MRDRRFFRMLIARLVLAIAMCMVLPACKKKETKKPGRAGSAAKGTGQKSREAPSIPEDAVASVGDLYILRAELDQEVKRLSGGRELPDEQRVALERSALDGLINRQLIIMAAEADDFEATDEEIGAELEVVIARRGGEKGFEAFLKSQNMDEEQYKEHLRISVLRGKLREKRFPEPITEEQMRAYYEQYSKSPNRGLKVKVARVFIGVPEEAAEEAWKVTEQKMAGIRTEIEGGLDFAEAAKKYSTDHYGKRGGVMGWATKGRRPEDVFAPGLKMKEGEISSVTRVSDGVQILKVIKRKDESAKGFEKERAHIEEILKHQKMERDDARLQDRLRREFLAETYL